MNRRRRRRQSSLSVLRRKKRPAGYLQLGWLIAELAS